MKRFILSISLVVVTFTSSAQVAYLLSPLSISAGTNTPLQSLTTNTVTGSIDVSMSSGFMLQGSFFAAAVNTNQTIGTGTLSFIASNSIDQLAWYRDAARDFSVAYTAAATNGASFQTNFAGLSNAAYWKYSVGNSGTNGNLVSPALQDGVKKGL